MAPSLDIFTGIRQVRIQGSFSRVLARIDRAPRRVLDVEKPTSSRSYQLIIMVITAVMPCDRDHRASSPTTARVYIQDGSSRALESAHFIAFLSALTAFFGSATLLGIGDTDHLRVSSRCSADCDRS